jgi:putative lipoic acid-binding regulatory protein
MSLAAGLSFPCSFPIKAMGLAEEGFEPLVLAIVRRHVIGEAAVTTRLSRGRRYVSVTVTIEALSPAQLDAIYRDLSGHGRVMMAL